MRTLLSTDQAAELLGVSRIRVRQIFHAGGLPGLEIAGRILFQPKDVERFRRTYRPRSDAGAKRPRR